jgi:hypothetical protein
MKKIIESKVYEVSNDLKLKVIQAVNNIVEKIKEKHL